MSIDGTVASVLHFSGYEGVSGLFDFIMNFKFGRTQSVRLQQPPTLLAPREFLNGTLRTVRVRECGAGEPALACGCVVVTRDVVVVGVHTHRERERERERERKRDSPSHAHADTETDTGSHTIQTLNTLHVAIFNITSPLPEATLKYFFSIFTSETILSCDL